MFSHGPPRMAKQKEGNQLEPIDSSSVRIRGVALRTCQKRWMIRRSGKRVWDIHAGGTTRWWWWTSLVLSTFNSNSFLTRKAEVWNKLIIPKFSNCLCPLTSLSLRFMNISLVLGWLTFSPFKHISLLIFRTLFIFHASSTS